MKSTIGMTSRYSDHVFAKVCHNMLPIAVEPASPISAFTPVVSVPLRLASLQAAHAATMNARFDTALIGSASSENPTRSQYSSKTSTLRHLHQLPVSNLHSGTRGENTP